ncbi:MAG: M20 family metallo-hydrolase [Bacteroidia bacterium]
MKEIAELLQQLIAIPSFSKEENETADLMASFLEAQGCSVLRKGNNVWVKNRFFDDSKFTLLLNSHHDTVKPNSAYTRNPFKASIEDGKLFGLGSNDAGGALVALLGAFLHFNERSDLPFNIIYAATAEEEISGKGGVESIISDLGNVQMAIVGEPTLMKMAVAERGLLVLDCVAKGKAGHAARNEGVNAVYEAMKDIEWFRTYQFEKASEWLGPVSMNVTVINAGTAHNQVPAECSFVVDVRLNECYTHQQVLEIIRTHVKAEVKERSTRIKPSFTATNHPMVMAAKELNIDLYGSPTTSDMALMPWKAVKIGPGDSARSHSADEFIYLQEPEDGIRIYTELIEQYAQQLKTIRA